MDFAKPNVVVSKCLGFASCRFNAMTISSSLVDSLRNHVNFITTCPEEEIGLGTPREPVRIVKTNDEKRLIQRKTERDLTADMHQFSSGFLGELSEIDGFILKAASPSCGIRDAKAYYSMDKGSACVKGKGLFGGAVKEAFPDTAVEDEGRLNNFSIREHFLSRIFISAKFRNLSQKPGMGKLVKFHSDHKYLFMSLNQSRLRVLGKIVANHNKFPVENVFKYYEAEMLNLLKNTPKSSTRINALHHVMGYFSKLMSGREKTHLLDLTERYREGNIPFSLPLEILKSYAIRNENSYIESQTFFEPYPSELIDMGDSGKGRLRK